MKIIDNILLILCVIAIVLIIKNVVNNEIEKLDLIDTSDNNPIIKGIKDMKSGFDKLGDFVKLLDGGVQALLKAFEPVTPGQKPCPSDMTDRDGSCWKDTYGRGTGRPRDGSCPHGWRNDGTSCWEDVKCNTVDKGYYNLSWGRWGCTGPTNEPTHAPWWLGGGLTGWNDCYKTWIAKLETTCSGCGCIKQGTSYSCRDDEEMNGLLCYPKCKDNYKAVGCCLCEPNDGPGGIRIWPTDRYECPPPGNTTHTKLVGALCYKP